MRLYTGPQFAQYNAVLRKFPEHMLDAMKNNTYTTTLHCINSGLIKLSRASPLTQRRVYRGSKKMRLPRQFAARDKLGHQCIVEMGFMSTTTQKEVALDYAAGDAMSMLLIFERGAVNSGASLAALSFYAAEAEICFPPLCNLEACAPPQMRVSKKGVVLEVYLQVSVNQHSDTIDALVQRRKGLHVNMLSNMLEEVEQELKPVDDAVHAILAVTEGAPPSAVAAVHRAYTASGKPSESALVAVTRVWPAGSLEAAAVDFKSRAEDVRSACKRVSNEHEALAATEFNQDDRYGQLVSNGVKMKNRAFGREGRSAHKDEVFTKPGQWFSDNAHTASVSTLESIVKNSDARLWAHPKVVDKEGRSMLCVAAKVGNVGICEKLVQVGADVKAADKAGRTPLLEASRAGSVAMCKGLIAARADVKVADKAGRTPLLEAITAGSDAICKDLIQAGGNGNVAGLDGVTPLVRAILSENSDISRLLNPKRTQSSDISDLGSFVEHMAQAFLQPANIEAWLRDGISPLALKGEASMLLSAPSVQPAMKEQLGHVRAFLNHNEALLEKSPSEWPVAHTVLQLASQEPGKVFAHTALGDEDTSPATRPPLIYWRNKPAYHRCRLTMRARGAVQSVSYSKCARKLARAEGNEVVVCDAETGFVECTLTGHRYVPSL